jgi:hypothetical protein
MPRVIRRAPELGFLPVAAVPAIVNEGQALISNVENLFSSHKYAQPQFEGAEKARADAAALGVAGGSVLAGQYLLSQTRTDTSDFARQYTQQILSALQSGQTTAPVMQHAALAGPVPDSADGFGVLSVLKQLGIPFSEQYAGFSTDSGNGPAGATADVVQYLKTLTVPSGTTSTTGTALSVAGIAGKTPAAFVWVLAIGGAAFAAYALSQGPKGRRRYRRR